MDGEEVTTMTSPTSLRIPPFGGTPGENLSSFFRRFDRAVRWVVYPRYPAGEEGRRQKEMDMALMIQDNLIGKALEESDAFPEAAYESLQAFKEALRQAFPQSETVAASKEDQRKVKAVFYIVQSVRPVPRTGLDCILAVRPAVLLGRTSPKKSSAGRTAVDCSRLQSDAKNRRKS